MHSRSRTPLSQLLLLSGVLILGPVGCASTKPRAKWWQFWRPKTVAAASIYHPDKVILPPPAVPGEMALGLGVGSGFRLGDDQFLPDPPPPLSDRLIVDAPPILPRREAPLADTPAGLLTVHFAYDSYELDVEAQRVLDQNLQWIVANPNVEIQVEGHCDERGTIEYNLLLGESRAKVIKAYLVSQGVDPQTVHTTSYGEERPIDSGHGTEAWARNRRAQFLVY